MAKHTIKSLEKQLKELQAQLKTKSVSSVAVEKKAVLGSFVEILPEAIAKADGFRPISIQFGKDSLIGGILSVSGWRNGSRNTCTARINDLASFMANMKGVKHIPYVKKE